MENFTGHYTDWPIFNEEGTNAVIEKMRDRGVALAREILAEEGKGEYTNASAILGVIIGFAHLSRAFEAALIANISKNMKGAEND